MVAGLALLALTALVVLGVVLLAVVLIGGLLAWIVPRTAAQLAANSDTLAQRAESLVRSFTFTLIITLAQLPGYFAAAWLIARFRFPGRDVLLTLIDLPFSVSPVSGWPPSMPRRAASTATAMVATPRL